MGENLSGRNGNVALRIDDDDLNVTDPGCCSLTLPFLQKVIAEAIGTYFLVFIGCAAGVVDADKEKVVTHPGAAIVWGLVLMAMIYSVGHVSGAHFNPSVTIAFATCKRFSWKQVPAYIAAQVLGATLASGSLRLLFNGSQDQFAGTLPSGTNLQSLVLEFIITFLLMFVISAVATDSRAVKEFAGLAIGSTLLVNVMFAGPISGASMNPARSLGPAIASSNYKGIWIYILGPTAGAIAGAWVYNILRSTDKPQPEIPRSGSFLRSSSRVISK
ncbi:Aquaporin NIP1-1 [Orobanche hederae]